MTQTLKMKLAPIPEIEERRVCSFKLYTGYERRIVNVKIKKYIGADKRVRADRRSNKERRK